MTILNNMRNRSLMLLAGGAAGALLLAGCSSAPPSDGPETTPAANSSSSVNEQVQELVPESIRDTGELRIATNGGYPPFEFYDTDNTTLLGADIDLITEVAAVMGLKPVFTIQPFDSHIASLKANRQDVVIAGMSDTAEREKEVDFVSYFMGGTSLLVPAGNPKDLSLETLCGLQIGVGAGTIYQSTYIPEWSDACTSAGEPEITIRVFKGNDDATLALTSGQVDATVSDYAPLTYTASHSNGKLEVVQEQYQPSPYGIAMNKDSALAAATQAAVQTLIDDGTYLEIMQEWSIEAGAVDEAVVNQATK